MRLNLDQSDQPNQSGQTVADELLYEAAIVSLFAAAKVDAHLKTQGEEAHGLDVKKYSDAQLSSAIEVIDEWTSGDTFSDSSQDEKEAMSALRGKLADELQQHAVNE